MADIDFDKEAINLTFEQLTPEQQKQSLKEGWSFQVSDKADGSGRVKGILFRPKQRQVYWSMAKYPAYIGAFGSGKSLILCLKAIAIALKYPGARLLIMRETYPQLIDTTITTLIKIFHHFEWRDKRDFDHIITRKTIELHTQPERSLILYRPARNEGQSLESAIADLQSLEVDAAFLDECPGIDERVYLAVQGRVGRWGKVTKEEDRQLMIAGNPPSQDHWIYKRYMEGKYPDGREIPDWPDNYFLVRASTYENKANLAPDYIKTLEAYPEWWRKTFLEGFWGFIPPDGEPVYPHFRHELYVSNKPLKYHEDRPLLRGWDLGIAGKFKGCVIGQLDPRGVLLILGEILTHDPGLENFALQVQKECAIRFPKCKEYQDFADPAAFDISQTDMKSPAMIFAEAGVRLKPGDKELQMRSEALTQIMGRLIDSSPGLFLDGVHCPKLVQAFSGGYRFKVLDEGNNRFSKTVVKDVHSHLMDALQYLCSRIFVVDKKKKNEMLAKIRARMKGYNEKKARGGYASYNR